MTGRPSKYSDAIVAQICEHLASGRSLRSFCAKEGNPSQSMVYRWLHDDVNGFREKYVRAREDQADTMADEMLDIADDGTNDWMQQHRGDDVRWVENGEALKRSQLRIESRKWLAGKMRPKVYGDKIQAEFNGNLTVSIVKYGDDTNSK